ncbi:MAG TPA: asparagine synthase-related protein [Actinomycetes bacterium]|nr:asparagine synthase-related protein [Actinomycetes bacterium]
MTITAVAVAGDRAVADLAAAWAVHVDRGNAVLVRHQATAVAWSTTCRWLETHDDGDLLVVLDGRLHDVAPPESQAEALASRYRSVGPKVAEGLTGDFVAIVLERSTRTLLVARDPVGARPWYQASSGDRHAGASEVATLTSLPWVDREVDEQTAIEHLAPVTASRGRTFHQGITTLRPGCTWTYHDGSVQTRRHHRWDIGPDLDISWDEAVERCRNELDAAVRRRLAISGPATSEISGGLDSSSVVGTIMGLGHQDLVVGRLVFDGPRADERKWSDAVIDHWGVPAVSTPPWLPSADESVSLTRQLDRPLPDPNFVMFASLRRELLATGRPDLLTGLGGDDAFVTMGMGLVVVSAVQLRQWRVLGRVVRASVVSPREAWRSLHRPALRHLARWRAPHLPDWVCPHAAQRVGLASSIGERASKRSGIAAIDRRLADLADGYVAAILESQAVVSDLIGSRASHPFFDPHLIGATYGLDPTWPTRGDHDRALEVLAYRDRIPRAVAERRSKAEFSEVFWPQLDAETLAEVRRGPLVARGWLDVAGFDRLVGDATKGRATAAIPLARCVSLDRWLRSR